MRAFLIMIVVGSLVACDAIKKGGTTPVSPDNTPIGVNSPQVIIELNRAIHNQTNKYMVTIRGSGGADDLRKGLPLCKGCEIPDDKSWSGSGIEIIEFANNSKGIQSTTTIPFSSIPLANGQPSRDHYQIDEVPEDPIPATKTNMDFIIKWYPGGQIDPATHKPVVGARSYDVNPLAGNVQVIAPGKPGFKYQYVIDDKNLVHIVSDTLPY